MDKIYLSVKVSSSVFIDDVTNNFGSAQRRRRNLLSWALPIGEECCDYAKQLSPSLRSTKMTPIAHHPRIDSCCEVTIPTHHAPSLPSLSNPVPSYFPLPIESSIKLQHPVSPPLSTAPHPTPNLHFTYLPLLQPPISRSLRRRR
jgi:hypothetical protein